jgi:predicted RND superfamily exporter protein
VAWWLVRFRGPLFLLAVALVAAGVERARHLKFSRSIDAMFDRSDPALVPFARMTRTFGGGEVVLCAYDDPELFTTAGIDRLAVLTRRLAGEPGVQATTSLASTPLGGSSPPTRAPPPGGSSRSWRDTWSGPTAARPPWPARSSLLPPRS